MVAHVCVCVLRLEGKLNGNIKYNRFHARKGVTNPL
jgi:hypothetical protein